MKNKKGGKAQKFIAQVEKQVKSGGQHNLLAPKPAQLEKDKKLKVSDALETAECDD